MQASSQANPERSSEGPGEITDENVFEFELFWWPIESESMSRHIWRHGDFKNVAYVHTFQVYDRFVTLGGF